MPLGGVEPPRLRKESPPCGQHAVCGIHPHTGSPLLGCRSNPATAQKQSALMGFSALDETINARRQKIRKNTAQTSSCDSGGGQSQAENSSSTMPFFFLFFHNHQQSVGMNEIMAVVFTTTHRLNQRSTLIQTVCGCKDHCHYFVHSD